MIEQIISNWIAGAALLGEPSILLNLLLIVAGVVLGLFFGVVPGLTAVLALVLMIPLTYGMEPVAAFGFLIAIYIGGVSGGFITAILLGIPGTPASLVTTFDGHPMAKMGKTKEALAFAVIASFFGGVVSWLALVLLTPQLVRVALSFGAFEYTALILFGFAIIGSYSSDAPLKGFLMTALGVAVASIGLDPIMGVERMTFGTQLLERGLQTVPVLLGLFVLSRAFIETETLLQKYIVPREQVGQHLPKLSELWESRINTLRSSLIGVGLGILPGLGAVLATFVSYDRARRASKSSPEFGKGNVEGVVASEAANNATTGAALIPVLALGIPGDAAMIVLMGAFMLHGVQPGAVFFSESQDVMYFIFIAYALANVVMAVFLLTVGIRLLTRALAVPKVYILPLIVVFALLGSYNIAYSLNDVWVTLGAGIFGYLALKACFPITPLVLGVILGPLLENHLRIAMMTSNGSLMPFVQRPVPLILGLLALLLISVKLASSFRRDSGRLT